MQKVAFPTRGKGRSSEEGEGMVRRADGHCSADTQTPAEPSLLWISQRQANRPLILVNKVVSVQKGCEKTVILR